MAKRVAVIGLSFRFPGTNQQTYWSDLLAGKDLVTEVDPQRWAKDAYLHPDKSHPGTSYTFSAGTIGDITRFDAAFFGISPREASLMDPQQRLLLEMGWEAIEHAGIKPSSLRGSDTGVYIGIASADYSYRLSDDFDAIDASFATGNTASIAANRLSYIFDLRGPSMAVDTACSSSMVAFHQACRAIATGEVTHALAGGVSLHLHPYGFVTFSKASMLSRKGRCNVFDASGDGYVRSEGGGLFLLKDYDTAVADGDHILCVIAHSAVNTDGRKSGITVPSVNAQATLMARAYEKAGIDIADIDYLEAHGTGTAVGDPIETRAISQALASARRKALPIGSVKSNMGHLEAASGVAGLAKAIYCLLHREVPATIGIKTINPNIKLDEWNLDIVTKPRALKPRGQLTIGVNSFGFGGANAHIILQSHEVEQPEASGLMATAALPVVVSARTPNALNAAALAMADRLQDMPPSALYDVAYHAAFRREWHDHRAVVFGTSASTIAAHLRTFSEGTLPKQEAASGTAVAHAQGAVLVYSGNGSQWVGMGRALLEDPVFAEVISQIDEYFEPLGGYKLSDDLAGHLDAARGDGYQRTEFAQPALFALQVGITSMLAHAGIKPQAVVGHSVGEVAAAWASGVLSLESATRVIYHRSRLQGRTKGNGAMTAVGVSGATIAGTLSGLKMTDRVSVAGYNSVRGATVAGHPDDLKTLENALGAKRIFHKRLDLDYAFHSPAMDPIEGDLLTALDGLSARAGSTPFYSAVHGKRIEGTEMGAEYWWRNIRESVRFEQAATALVEDGFNIFIEVGPHPVLKSYVSDAVKAGERDGRQIVTGQRGELHVGKVRSAAGQALVAGAKVDWHSYFPGPGRYVDLASYPWQREVHWHVTTAQAGQSLYRTREHALLGYRLKQHAAAWENQLDTCRCPTLGDHVVGNATVFPGAGFVEIALAAAFAHQHAAFAEVEEIDIRAPLLLEDDETKILHTLLETGDGKLTIQAKTQGSEDDFTAHAYARVLAEPKGLGLVDAAPVWPARAPDFDGEEHIALTRAVGLSYGPAYSAVAHGWQENEHTVIARLVADPSINQELVGAHLHPAMLDCTFQLIIQLLKHDLSLGTGSAFVPAKVGRVIARAGEHRVSGVRATVLRRTPHALVARFSLFDEDGVQIAAIEEARFRSVRLQKNPLDQLSFPDYLAVPVPRHTVHTHPLADVQFNELVGGLRKVSQEPALASTALRFASEVEPLADALAIQFAREALLSMADAQGHLPSGTVEALRAHSPDQAILLNSILTRLVEDESARVTPTGWTLLIDAEQPPAIDIWNSLLREYPDYFAIVQTIGRVGQHLPKLLSHERTLVDTTPRDATPAALASHVQGLAVRQDLSRYLTTFALDVQQHLSAGARLSLLEIGAAAPLMGVELCAHIDPHLTSYAFASGDADTLAASHRQLDNYPDALLIDLTATGGDDLQHADLVVLDVGLMSLPDARRSLAFASQQLAPHGALLLVNSYPAFWLDLIFGTEPTWWAEATNGGRVSRQQPPAFWQAELRALGLSCEDPVDFAPDASSGAYVLSAQPTARALAAQVSTGAVQDSASAPAPGKIPLWLILTDEDADASRLSADLSQTLGAAGHNIVVRTPTWETDMRDEVASLPSGISSAAQPMMALLADVSRQHGSIDHIVHAHGLTRHEPSDANASLAAQTRRCAIAAEIAQACEANASSACIWVLTQGAHVLMRDALARESGSSTITYAHDATLWGYARTMMNEASGYSVRAIDLDYDLDEHIAPLNAALAAEMLAPDRDAELLLGVGEKGVIRRAPRMASLPRPRPSLKKAEHGVETDSGSTIKLGFEFPGQLRNLRWEAHAALEPALDEVEVDIHATGLNFRDVMYALGMLSDEAIENGFAGPSLGLEFSGVVRRVGADVDTYQPGDRVVGFGPSSFGNRMLTKVSAISHMPRHMSFEAAATIPSTFFTVYYAFEHLAKLSRGEKVLIHGAAGGVGIAAIQYAQHIGAEIYATAGSSEKRDFLRLMGVTHIYDSRALTFADEILADTNGKGVDVVLNSLAGEAVNRNFRVLKPFGRFLELGKRDFYENTRIGLRPFRNNISYFGIDADQLMHARPELTHRLFADMMGLFEQGVLHALPYRLFDASEIVDAFRFMQQARQIGKIVVTYRNGIQQTHTAVERRKPNRLELDADASYLVTGGLGGFGLRTAQWLVERGARHLVLASRSGPASSEAQQALAAFQAQGVKVLAQACDVTDRSALQALLEQAAAELPVIKGIVHAAVVIDDGLVRGMTGAQLQRTMAAKILGARHLHELTTALPLDLFVMFSSATTLLGNPGQSNYVAANTWLEGLAVRRRQAGLPATCVKWGAIDDVGFLAQNESIKQALQSRMGGSALSSDVALRALEDMILAQANNLGVMELDWRALSRFLPSATQPKFSALARRSKHDASEEGQCNDISLWITTLSDAELHMRFVELLRHEVGDILRVTPEKIDPTRSIYDMGLDSLMGVELVVALEARFGVRLPVMALNDSPTLSKLADRLIKMLKGDEVPDASQADGTRAQIEQIAAQHDAAITPAALEELTEKLAASGDQPNRMIH